MRGLCRCLKVTRNRIYYQRQLPQQPQDVVLSERVGRVFNDNYRAYGTRRLQAELRKQGMILSRRRIGRIMAKNGWVSKYTCKKYRIHVGKSNESSVGNELNREFEIGQPRKILVTDLTYVRVKER